MTRFVLLTDDPEKARRYWSNASGWTERSFPNAAEALHWERIMRRSGAVALEGQGHRYGLSFEVGSRGDRWAVGA